jgi:putative aminopeptidase FrvX
MIFTEKEPKRGTVLPLKASGHTYNEEIDTQETSWEHIEVRVDENTESVEDLRKHSFEVGDFIAFDPNFEITPNGFINSRHLDNKAGVAALLSTAKAIVDSGAELPTNAHLLFTIMEEVGSGASAVLHGDVAEMLSIDNSTVAPGQNSNPNGVTVAIKDSTGPFDYHLTKHIIDLCKEQKLNYTRDVFRYYRCDAASAIEAGNDIRAALVCFACDASHGYERTHIDSLHELSKLLSFYLQSSAVSERDKTPLNEFSGFSSQPIVKDPLIDPNKPVRSDQYEEGESED